MSTITDSRGCEECSHCQTINDDMDNYCHLQQRVVRVVCDKFDPWDGKGAQDND